MYLGRDITPLNILLTFSESQPHVYQALAPFALAGAMGVPDGVT